MSRGNPKPVVSVIIPTYNEGRVIGDCIASLSRQSEKNIEIIVVDDGSTDNTVKTVKRLMEQTTDLKLLLLNQSHKGPGEARNLGARVSSGNILVFVDADMTFDEKFIEKLILPIRQGSAFGTDTQEAYLANAENYWALSWNLGRFHSAKMSGGNPYVEMIPNKSDFGGVFRAVLRKEFLKVKGFDSGGDYSDDISLGRKLGKKALLAKGAIYYHKNPDNISDVWRRAVWIGSDSNLSHNNFTKAVNIIKFFPPFSIIKGFVIALHYRYLPFILFKIVYDTAVFYSLIKSL